MRVLVIEDDEELAQAITVGLRQEQLAVDVAGPDDELKELGDTFDQLLGRLDASFGAQRQFVANASHELRTPLARQRTLLEVALRDPEASTASLRAACERALAAGEQQERLIGGLLLLARGERGLDRFEPVDLAAVAADVLAARRTTRGSARSASSPASRPPPRRATPAWPSAWSRTWSTTRSGTTRPTAGWRSASAREQAGRSLRWPTPARSSRPTRWPGCSGRSSGWIRPAGRRADWGWGWPSSAPSPPPTEPSCAR